jgi:bifunctional enzyme CysN/CysC
MVTGTIPTLRYRVDVNTMKSQPAPTLELNQIGRVNIHLNQAICFDPYQKNKTTGAFIVIDRITNVTVGAGMILDRRTSEDRHDAWDVEPQSENLKTEISNVTADERKARFGQRAVSLLITGMPGAGKTTTAYGLERRLFDRGRSATVLDGQNLRVGLARDLGFSKEDRSENLRRAAEVARLMNNAGIICVMALVSPDEETRQRAAQVIQPDNFIVIHLDAPAELCAQRNLSARREGAVEETMTHYEPPETADLVLDTSQLSAVECVDAIIQMLESKDVIQ